MKYLYTFSVIFLFHNFCYGQATIELKSKFSPQVNETYNVLKSDNSILQGQYLASYKKQTVALGRYINNIKSGIWSFYNQKGKLLQRYNYTTKLLIHEAPEDSTSRIAYVVDHVIQDTDRITKPIRLGGRYFGYLPYTNIIKLPSDFSELSNQQSVVTMELLVSPGGRLAEFKVRIKTLLYPDVLLNVNINLLDAEDKIFIPATLNYQPVSARIVLNVKLRGADRVTL